MADIYPAGPARPSARACCHRARLEADHKFPRSIRDAGPKPLHQSEGAGYKRLPDPNHSFPELAVRIRKEE